VPVHRDPAHPHWYMGGRASQAWGVSVRDVGYALLWNPPAPAPAPAPAPEVKADAVEVVAEPEPVAEQVVHMHTQTDVTGHGVVGLGRWLVRFWFMIKISRR
jgi:hypothetical protein